MINVTGCRLLIKPLKLEDNDKVVRSAKAAGIALLPQDERKAQVNIDKGYVLQIGPKCSPDYIEGVRVGDLIGFTKFGGKFLREEDTPEGEEVLAINDEDVICVFRK